MYKERFRSLRLVKSHDVDPAKRYDVAYLIRMKNESASLQATIDSIARQAFGGTSILIFLDSGSTDESIEIATKSPIPYRIYAIDSQEFQFGATCNLIAELADADYFLFLSGHVLLNQADMIATSVDYMTQNPVVAGLSFRQVPNDSTGFNLYEQVYLRRTFPRLEQAYTDVRTAGAFSNACSLVRASTWDRIPFEHVGGSEDHLWAQAAIAEGMEVRYTSLFDVAHSHDEAPAAIFKRVRINKVARFGEGIQPLRFAKSLLGIFVTLSLASKGRKMGVAATYALAHASAYISSRTFFPVHK